MTLNPFFSNYSYAPEQNLLSSLIVESIRQYGMDMLYLPRRPGNLDEITKTDDLSYFDKAITIEMYLRNVEAFEGQGEFLSKFGMEIRDRVTLTVARQAFADTVTGQETTITRPREGDLIYFPMTRKMFEIMYVDNRVDFYPLGTLPMIDLQCEVFEYNNEHFATGVQDIDEIEQEYSLNEVDHYLHDSQGNIEYDNTGEPVIDPAWEPDDIDPGQVNKDIQTDIDAKFTNVDVFNKFKN